MPAQCKVAFGFALLRATQNGIELVNGFARHERAQKRDRSPNHRKIDVKVRVPPSVGTPDAEIEMVGVAGLTTVEFEDATAPRGL